MRLRVNGEDREVLAPVHHTLLEVLREDLGLIGTKHGCELGECGTCTVLLEGRPVLSCLTIPVGYCTPGFLLVAEALLATNLRPTRPQIAEALAGNLCRCTGYLKIFEAVELAAARMRGETTAPEPARG
jgi:aerobic-type carbon monoxide dehydrogenase small subunit (CoxS/CutS family)